MDDGADAPPWTLWRFAWQVCPLLCRAYGRFATAQTLGLWGHAQAERRVLARYPRATGRRLQHLIEEESAARLRQMRSMAVRLLDFEIPTRLRRRLAGGGFQVTYAAAEGSRAVVPIEIVNGLSFQLLSDRLVWPAQTFEGVMVMPISTPPPDHKQHQKTMKQRYSAPALKAWFELRVRTWPPDQRTPTFAECRLAAEQYFDRVPAGEFKIIRPAKTPESWRIQGPRGSRNI